MKRTNGKYIDISSINQVIGCIYNNPQLLEDTKYFYNEEDFPKGVTRIIFGTIFNLYHQGVKKISVESIEDYLEQRPKSKAEYKSNKGDEYLLRVAENSKPAAFDYYYNRMKKMSLFRAYDSLGIDLSDLYDPDNILDSKKMQEQEDKIDNMSLDEIADIIDKKVLDIRMKYIDDKTEDGSDAGAGIDELLESFKESPEFGYPLYGKYVNTITRGARPGKYYLRSAATGVGKSRSMIADICQIGCSQIYDLIQNKWVTCGACQGVLYISTELDLSECQTMMIAFIAGVNEEHILNGEYYAGEWERVQKAAMLLKQSKIRIDLLPDFTLKDVEDTVKRGIREYGARFIFMDYIHTSMGILAEISQRTKGVNVREDQVLFLMSAKLKDIANQYDVFILSSTQLNASYQESETPDQNLLRGSKAVADRLDVGMILLEITEKDREAIAPICKKLGIPVESINVKLSIYKNRRGRWKGVYLWMIADRGTCRFDGQFVTTWNYRMEDITDIRLKVEEESSF